MNGAAGGVLRLADGRALAYQISGEPDGTPVVLFHGAPGSRLFRPEEGVLAASVRLVTFDRPGYGGSDPVPARSLGGTANDVSALVDHLGLAKFALAGWSGGGPFAVACAHALAPRVTRLAIVSAPGPLDEVPGAWDRLGDYRRPTAEMARREPDRSVRAIARHMVPFLANPSSFLGSGRGADGAILRGSARRMLDAQVVEALRQGAAGISADLVAMWLEWPFRLADVRVHAHVWQGALDQNNAVDAQTYATFMPDARLTVWPECGHLGIVAHWAEVIGRLCD